MSEPGPVEWGARWEKTPEVVRREIAGEILLVPVRGELAQLQRIFVLNPVAAHIWERLDGARDLEQICVSVLEHFEVGEEEARRDLLELVSALREAGLIRLAPTREGG